MSFVVLIENDMNVHLDELRLEEDRTPITDAELVAHFGAVGDPVATIAGATNANPIVITSPAHGLANGEQVIVSQVRGNAAANGLRTVANVTADTFELSGVAGDGDYFAGGVWYRAVEGATDIPLEFVVGTACRYRGTVTRDNCFVDRRRYVMVVECSNYGVKFETTGLARVRT